MRSEETGSTHRPPVRTLAVIRFVVTWYLALLLALLACVSGRWEVVLAAAAMGVGLDLLRRRPLRAMLAAAATAGPGEWSFRYVDTRPWVALAIALAVVYWAAAIWWIATPDAPVPDWAPVVLDHLLSAGNNVEKMIRLGYPDAAVKMTKTYLAICPFVVSGCCILIIVATFNITIIQIKIDYFMDRRQIGVLRSCLSLAAFQVGILCCMVLIYGPFIEWDGLPRYKLAPHLHGLHYLMWGIAAYGVMSAVDLTYKHSVFVIWYYGEDRMKNTYDMETGK